MPKSISDHIYVNRPFESICADLAADGQALITEATRAADEFAADLADYLDDRLGFFDRDEQVHVESGPLTHTDGTASMTITWVADSHKRLLPNVSASMRVKPIISRGSSATSELTLRGVYDPPPSRRRHPVEQAVARRVVDATLHTFLRRLAERLDHRPEPTMQEQQRSL